MPPVHASTHPATIEDRLDRTRIGPSTHYEWAFWNDNHWKKYDSKSRSNAAITIENLFNDPFGPQQTSLGLSMANGAVEEWYDVDLTKMTQTNRRTKFERPIRRETVDATELWEVQWDLRSGEWTPLHDFDQGLLSAARRAGRTRVRLWGERGDRCFSCEWSPSEAMEAGGQGVLEDMSGRPFSIRWGGGGTPPAPKVAIDAPEAPPGAAGFAALSGDAAAMPSREQPSGAAAVEVCGRIIPTVTPLVDPAARARFHVLVDTVQRLALEGAPAETESHRHAKANLERWRHAATAAGPIVAPRARVRVESGDWGDVTLRLTKETGRIFAVLNMANAYCPGGGYVEGMPAQEENMFRRTDCHFTITSAEMDVRSLRCHRRWPSSSHRAPVRRVAAVESH